MMFFYLLFPFSLRRQLSFTPLKRYVSNQAINVTQTKCIISHSNMNDERICKLGCARNWIYFFLPCFQIETSQVRDFVRAPRGNSKLPVTVCVVAIAIDLHRDGESNFDDEQQTAQRWNKRRILFLTVKNLTHTLHIRATNQTLPFLYFIRSFSFFIFFVFFFFVLFIPASVYHFIYPKTLWRMLRIRIINK